MSFRLSISNLRRASLAGLVCLAFAGALRAEDVGSRRIEIVPFHGTQMDTNFDQGSAETRTFELLSPRAPRTFQTTRPPASVLPLPRPEPTPSQRERELLDRRRNWVFMTPEEFASPSGKKDSDLNGDEKTGDSSLTVMERYYRRLNDADRMAATNQINRPELDRLNGQTNFLTERMRNEDATPFGPSPFNTAPDPGVFGATRPNDFSSGFNSGGGVAMPSPEEVRQQAEQKAHMDSFKELWNIDQPAAVSAPATVSAPAPTPVDSAPVFGASPGVHPLFNANSFGGGGFSAPQQPGQPTMTSSRNSVPPRGTFTPPQRPF